MTQFNKGDKVRYKASGVSNPEWAGLEGEVTSELASLASPWSGTRRSVGLVVTKDVKGSRDMGYYTGSTVTTQASNLELIKPEPTFKEGDRVTIKGFGSPGGNYEGKTGTIDHMYGGVNTARVLLEDSPHKEGTFNVKYLVPAEPKPFTFEDIQAGDTIRRTAVGDGYTEVREGVVCGLMKWYAYSKDNKYILAYDKTSEIMHDVTYELLNRPEPKPEPKLWENRKAGDQIIREAGNGNTHRTIFTKRADGIWNSFYLPVGKAPEKGYTWEDSELADLFDGETLHLIKA